MGVGQPEGAMTMGCGCGGAKKNPNVEYVATDRTTGESKVFQTRPEARAYAAAVQGGATVVARQKKT